MILAGAGIGAALLLLLLIGVWAVLASVAVLGARLLGLPERPPLLFASVLFFVLLWSVPITAAYRLFWTDRDDE